MTMEPVSWAEADPARHPFDPGGVPAVVRAIAPPVPPAPYHDGLRHVGGEAAGQWLQAMTAALAGRYGRWASGWNHTPGSALWCCPDHSITTPGGTVALVADLLIEWRGWLEDLAERFSRFLPLPGPAPEALAAWETAVAHLVTAAAGRAGVDDGWPGVAGQVLRWFLEAAGVPARQHDDLIGHAIGGRFSSWIQPTTAEIADVAEDFARELLGEPVVRRADLGGRAAEDLPDTWPDGWPSWRATNRPAGARSRPEDDPRPDDLDSWRAVRTRVDWSAAARPVTGPARSGRDGMAEHAARRRTGSRALLAALDLVDAAVAEGGPLTFARLAGWQRAVLGVSEAPFRTGPARAKGGLERYSWRPDLPELFEQVLAEATGDDLPLASRAARLYLDVIFFHPFDDGNARAAMLAVRYLLAREGVVLDRAAPLLMTVRRAGDEFGAAGLAQLVEMLIRQTRQVGRKSCA